MGEDLERFAPGLQGEIWYEHWHRYHWARARVGGLRVLDAACGEGYGSALMAEVAAQVTGLDIAPEVVAQAAARYGGRPNLAYAQADLGERIPLPDASVEAIVSFETIEHFANQSRFVGEVARVLAPGGLFLVSSPNRDEYSPQGAAQNPHHVREMNEREFAELLAPHFPAQRWFAQAVDFHSVIAPLGRASANGEMVSATSRTAATPGNALRQAKYFLCACAREEADLERIGDPLSVLHDEEHYILADHRHLLAAVEHLNAEREQLRARLEAAERAASRLAVERNRALLAPRPGE